MKIYGAKVHYAGDKLWGFYGISVFVSFRFV